LLSDSICNFPVDNSTTFKYYLVLLSKMETICIKIDKNMSQKISKSMKAFGYSTKTEFIREALRDKLDDNEKEILIREFLMYKGRAKMSTTCKDNAKTREKAILELANEKGWKLE